MKDAEQKKLNTVLLVIGCLTLFFTVFSGYFIYSLLNLKQTADNLYLTNMKFEDEESNAQALRDFVDGTQSEQEALASYFIENKNEITLLLEELEAAASSLDVELKTSITTGKMEIPRKSATEKKTTKAGPQQNILRLELQVSGAFQDVYAFLVLIKNIHLKISFENVRFQRVLDIPLGKGKGPEWVGLLSVSVLSYKE